MAEKQAHSSFKHVQGKGKREGRKERKHGQFLDNAATHSNFLVRAQRVSNGLIWNRLNNQLRAATPTDKGKAHSAM